MSNIRADAAYAIAETIAKTDYDDLPLPVVDATKKSIVDTLGVMIAASGMNESVKTLSKVISKLGGKKQSTILGFGSKVPAHMAAFVNGAMTHCLDYDDIEYESTYHPSCGVVPAALALAEGKQEQVEGRNLITAVTVGQDIGIRMALAIPSKRKPPWHRTAVINAFAGAAAAAKVLNLNKEQIVDSIGIALCQAAGSMELRWGTGSDIGAIHAAFPARAAAFSALLAQEGISGIKNSLEGAAGFFNLYYQGQYDRSTLLADLGKKFLTENIALKPWPVCAGAFTCVDALKEIVKENNIAPQQIEKIIAYVGDWTKNLCEPLNERQTPRSAIEAKYSIPFCLGVMALKGGIAIDDFNSDSLRNPDVLSLAQKVIPQYSSEYDIIKGLPPGAIEVVTTAGKKIFRKALKPFGHPEKPLTWDDVNAKFQDCAAHSVRPLSRDDAMKFIDHIRGLEHVRDARKIASMVSSSS
jgi:2-methylcitrate dehydratase PrpD